MPTTPAQNLRQRALSMLSKWGPWALSKLGRSAILLLGSSLIIYALLRSTPGDIVNLILGDGVSAEEVAMLRKDLSLDVPIFEGYLGWLRRALTGDLGVSMRVHQGVPVLEVTSAAFLITLSIAGSALGILITISYLIAAYLGPPRAQEMIILGPLKLLNAAPSFIVSMGFIKFANELLRDRYDYGEAPPWYPVGVGIDIDVTWVPIGFAIIVVCLGDGLFTDLFNTLRAELTSLQRSQFINAIRAKGAAPLPHIIKNLIVPTLSIFTARLPLVLSAVIIVEYIFQLGGSGYVLLEAAKHRDLPVIVGMSLFFIFAVIIMNLVLDVVKALVDPREVVRGDS